VASIESHSLFSSNIILHAIIRCIGCNNYHDNIVASIKSHSLFSSTIYYLEIQAYDTSYNVVKKYILHSKTENHATSSLILSYAMMSVIIVCGAFTHLTNPNQQVSQDLHHRNRNQFTRIQNVHPCQEQSHSKP
jgi:hypothetical protein